MLHESDVFANPSHTEGFPRSVLEAAAAGLPIVATDVGGTREIIEHRKSGILIPAKNISALVSALTELAHDAELRDRLGNEAARRSRSFSVEQMINSYEAYFTAHGVL
jgi:glycosyltransferase involved in cell wall biosynthesis